MRKSLPARGLYAITPDRPYGKGELLSATASALRGGAVVLQYRRKTVPPEEARREIEDLLPLCEKHGAILIVNDDIRLALITGAHGVHLGREDGDYQQLLSAPDRRLLIGVSCYDSLASARTAAASGVDYVAFGSVFRSSTKPAAVQCPHAVLRAARQELHCPIVAIGGITPDNAKQVVDAGAHFVAAIDGIFAAPDIEESAARYARIFTS